MTGWTADHDGELVWTDEDGRAWTLDLDGLEDLWTASNDANDGAALSALVAAVRDADRYQKAAGLARQVRAETGDDQTLIPIILDVLTGEDVIP